MEIKVLGSGCPKCKATEKVATEAVNELGISADIIKVTDFKDILKFGVMTTPALVIDGQVVVKGRVPSIKEVKELLSK